MNPYYYETFISKILLFLDWLFKRYRKMKIFFFFHFATRAQDLTDWRGLTRDSYIIGITHNLCSRLLTLKSVSKNQTST